MIAHDVGNFKYPAEKGRDTNGQFVESTIDGLLYK